MNKFNSYINDHVLFRVANLNTATIIIKIMAGILTSKAIAVFIGVEGMALIGNLRNFLSAVHTFSITGFYDGLVKSIAEVKNDTFKLSQTLSSAFYIGFLSTILVAFVSYYNAETINQFLFSANYKYAYVIKIMALALPFYALNMFSFAIMNGFEKYKILLIISIIGQVLGLLITLLLIYQNNIDGALVAAVIAPSLILLVTFVGFVNQRSLVSSVKISNVSFSVLKKFAPYAVMALVTAIAIPMVSIMIRNYIIAEVGIKEAGHWEAMQRISDYYLMFINSLMALYFLPRFSEIESKKEFRKEVFSFYKSTMPIFGIGLVIIYLLRSVLVPLIFSEDFQPTEELFLWQLLGDFVKVLSIVIAYQFIAKKMFTQFIIIETFLVVVMYLSSVYLIDVFGVEGAVMGHFVSYVMHYGIILLIFGSSLFGVLQEHNEG
ncbi:PST family polysaccharide transporter [Gelidibacter algens]|uniref:PST family polysaccharide transporter n=1 Tax=Gelidibacter algens TaxID=49280 RepID=A0A1A7R597_9FLAO|nr:O-antigen translocase [Gelidibacter algens]OBX27036.1 lipopolysaccharide biosynthesis protein [Gelidibacter algens]RAJ28023.1 PST family polysaccharide transporter [Gelidibacter algens]